MKICCVFSLESPHRAILISIHNIPFSIKNIKKKITLNFIKFDAVGFFPKDAKSSSN